MNGAQQAIQTFNAFFLILLPGPALQIATNHLALKKQIFGTFGRKFTARQLAQPLKNHPKLRH